MPLDRQSDCVLDLPVEVPAPTRNRESHVPRDMSERPLVGFCGYVAHDVGRAPRDAAPGELATCVVCQDLWDSGVRPLGWFP